MPSPAAQNVVHFGPFRVDLAAERLWNGSDPLPLRAKTWQVLRHLVENADRLVTKDDLLDAVWKDVAVEEKAVNTCIGEIRAALGDSSRRPRYIETVPRRGFRFLLSQDTEQDAALAQSTSRGSFVGRRAELETLRARLADKNGGPALVVVSGAAGIGKSRLVSEAVARADRRALAGQCIEGGGLPYLPWVEMMRQELRSRAFATELSTSAELERLIPGLETEAATLQPSSDPELARLRLFEALAGFFEDAARREPLVLVLEDLHWIDGASLRALQALLPRLSETPALLLATLRDEDAAAGSPLRTALEALRRRGLVAELPLRGLEAGEARELVSGLASDTLPPALVARIADSSEGSPFFVEEMLRHYDAGTAAGDASGLSLPDNVIEMFERRLRDLPAMTRRLAEVIAVSGQDCDEPLLEQVLQLGEGELELPIGEAFERRILREHPERPGSYRLVHALMSVAIVQKLAPPARRAMHAKLADAFATMRGDDAARAAAMARHLARAVPAVPAARAIDALVEAAGHAARGLAYEDAIEHSSKALALARSTSTEAARLAELAVRHAEALQKIGDAESVAAAFREAAALARDTGDPQWLARAALGMATIWDFEAPDARGFLEEALARLGDGHEALRARLLARLAVVLYPLPGTRARCEELSSEALRLAREVADPQLLAQTLVDWLAGQWYPDNLAAQQAVSEELVDAATRSGDTALLATAHGWCVVIALGQGEVERAEQHSAMLTRLVRTLDQPLYRWISSYLAATLALMRGDLATAERLAGEAFEPGRLASPQAATIVYFSQMSSIRREQDRVGELLPLLEQNPSRMSNDSLVWNIAHFYIEADRLEDGAAAFRKACALGLDAMPGENSRNRRSLTIGAMSLACAALGDRETAAKLYEIAKPQASRWAVSGFGAVNFGVLANAAGALAGCLGRYDEAAELLEAAIAEYERKDIPIPLARACCLYAQALLSRGEAGDAERAARLLERASKIASELGLERVRVLVRRLEQRGSVETRPSA